MGLKAGGITGKIVKIIQAGLDPVPTKFSRAIIRLLTNFINSFCSSHFDSSYIGFSLFSTVQTKIKHRILKISDFRLSFSNSLN
jgi:hypothetical protein